MKLYRTKLAIAFLFLISGIPASSQVITTFAPYSGAIALDATGNLFIRNGNLIRKITPGGIATVIAGTGTSGFSGDGGPATAAQLEMNGWGISVDVTGNVYFTDNNRVRMINSSGIISTIAGSGTWGYAGDGGPATAAEFRLCQAITVDPAGNIYVGDYDNYVIRKINTSGIISTIAGIAETHGSTGDGGPATSALLRLVRGLTIDASGNLLIADFGKIRRISTTGVITTVCGLGTVGFSGDGGSAISAQADPRAIADDGMGNIFVADGDNDRIRKIAASGIINTVAGTGVWGYSGDGGPAIAAKLAVPMDLKIDVSGNIFINDVENGVIRKIASTTIVNQKFTKEIGLSFSPNPCHGVLNIKTAYKSTSEKSIITISDLNGMEVYRREAIRKNGTISEDVRLDAHITNGLYNLQIISSSEKEVGTFVLER